MGQPQVSKQMESAQIQTQQQQNQIAQDTIATQKQRDAQAQELIKPAIDKYTAQADPNNRTAALEASMPVLSQVSQGYQAAKQSILNSVPAGPARDKAIADLEMQKFTTTSGAQAQIIQDAPDKLATLSNVIEGNALQYLGASLAGNQGAATTAGQVQGAADARKAQNLQLLGGLAGTAGSVAGKYIGKPSDRRIKQNIDKVEGILSRIADIEVYAYEYVSTRYDPHGKRHIGVMAQDVGKEFPEATGVDQKAGREYMTVDPYAIASLALGAVKELAERVRALEEKLSMKGVYSG